MITIGNFKFHKDKLPASILAEEKIHPTIVEVLHVTLYGGKCTLPKTDIDLTHVYAFAAKHDIKPLLATLQRQILAAISAGRQDVNFWIREIEKSKDYEFLTKLVSIKVGRLRQDITDTLSRLPLSERAII